MIKICSALQHPEPFMFFLFHLFKYLQKQTLVYFDDISSDHLTKILLALQLEIWKVCYAFSLISSE